MKQCPYCGEEIQDTAKKCRYCGEWLDNEVEEKKQAQNDSLQSEPHSATITEKDHTQQKRPATQKKAKIKVPGIWPNAPRIIHLSLVLLVLFCVGFCGLKSDESYLFSVISEAITVALLGLIYIRFKTHHYGTPLCNASLLMIIISSSLLIFLELFFECTSNQFLELLSEESAEVIPAVMFACFTIVVAVIGYILLIVSWLRDYTDNVKIAGWLLLASVVLDLVGGLTEGMPEVLPAFAEVVAFGYVIAGEKMYNQS